VERAVGGAALRSRAAITVRILGEGSSWIRKGSSLSVQIRRTRRVGSRSGARSRIRGSTGKRRCWAGAS